MTANDLLKELQDCKVAAGGRKSDTTPCTCSVQLFVAACVMIWVCLKMLG